MKPDFLDYYIISKTFSIKNLKKILIVPNFRLLTQTLTFYYIILCIM